MTLPADKSAWPPADQTRRYSHMRVASTWYGGDPEELRTLYSGVNSARASEREIHHGRIAGWLASAFGWLWGRIDPSQPDDKLHVPVATDIATMSADLLFARSPKFVVQPTVFDDEGKPAESEAGEIAKTQTRLDDLLDAIGFDALLLAAAETQSPLGSVGLKIAWDKARIPERPTIVRVDADAVVPEYHFGVLTAVTFWSVVHRKGDQWFYHLERHEPGAIWHGLYKGEPGNLGIRVPLTESGVTAPLEALVDAEGKIATPGKAFTAVSIPNMLPDPLDRSSHCGRSDFTPGVIQLFDAIDKTYTSMMRDIDDGRSRLVVADYMLESKGIGKGVEFDSDQHLFTKLKMSPGEKGDPPISQVQFNIRVEQHIAAIEKLTRKAIESAGYSPQTLGDYEAGSAMTATEVEARERKSIGTMSKKRRYWQAVEQLVNALLVVDAEEFGSGVKPKPVKIEWQSIATDSMKTLAETVKLMKEAEAASLEVRVRTMHPDWDPDAVLEEVKAIQAEKSVVDPATFGLPGVGAPLPPAEDDAFEEVPPGTEAE